jgi:hypothetical protein
MQGIRDDLGLVHDAQYRFKFPPVSEMQFCIQVDHLQIISSRQDRGAVTQKIAGVKGQMGKTHRYKSSLHFDRVVNGTKS